MAVIQDETMAEDGRDGDSHLALSEDEQKILELYDQLQEMRLEIAIINAQHAYQGDHENATEEEVKRAQDALLEARAKYTLRNNVVEAAMEATPVLRAVHNGTHASPVERDLLPHVERRDEVTKLVAKDASDMAELRRKLTEVQSQTLRVSRKNVELAAELFELTNQLKGRTARNWEDSDRWQELSQAQTELKSSKRRWRIMKGVASGIIVGSGVDWAADEQLCEIVLDLENEDT